MTKEKAYDGADRRQCSVHDAIFSPVDGVISQLHEKINSRPTWSAVRIYIAVVMIVALGSYAYVTIEAAGLREVARLDNDRQDKVVLELKSDVRSALQEIRKINESIIEHRASTEGKGRK